ncbi:hypothetical protein LCGC14_0365350 [marine sediment metagenome]|uniref:GIY-YIG domain-containing protein n=1 Tax=marine sediment metagenome TaxID=412755 RepID=A0A0F9TCK2_9ZZZZ
MEKEVKDVYKYLFKVNGVIKHIGITKAPERREQEHQLEYPDGHIKVVGCCTTEEIAREWEVVMWRKINGY